MESLSSIHQYYFAFSVCLLIIISVMVDWALKSINLSICVFLNALESLESGHVHWLGVKINYLSICVFLNALESLESGHVHWLGVKINYLSICVFLNTLESGRTCYYYRCCFLIIGGSSRRRRRSSNSISSSSSSSYSRNSGSCSSSGNSTTMKVGVEVVVVIAAVERIDDWRHLRGCVLQTQTSVRTITVGVRMSVSTPVEPLSADAPSLALDSVRTNGNVLVSLFYYITAQSSSLLGLSFCRWNKITALDRSLLHTCCASKDSAIFVISSSCYICKIHTAIFAKSTLCNICNVVQYW